MAKEIIRFTFHDSSFVNKAFEIRRVVFVFEQDCPPELEYENEEICQHYLAYMDGVPAATARWRETENGIKLERFAVLKEYRLNGIALALVNRLLEDVKPFNKAIYLHAQIEAMPLYAKAGFEPTGPQFEEAGIQHFKMIYKK
ncbi:MAG: GNAT family N-acetyltransferase [Bacteroidia bacterium]